MFDSTAPVFLHISDSHFTVIGTTASNQDLKHPLVGTAARTNEVLFESTLSAIEKLLGSKKVTAILLTGDYDNCGLTGGMKLLRDMLKRKLGDTPIVVVPGNHDVLRDSDPGSNERYKEFIKCWRDRGLAHVTPFLDNIDSFKNIEKNFQKHCFVDPDKKFFIVPINSCNWSQSKLKNRKDFDVEFWDELPTLAGNKNPVKIAVIREKIKSQLGGLLAADAALISDDQFKALNKIVELAERETIKGGVKIALIHHHLLPVDSSEEHKIYGDIINLGMFRQFLRQHGFHILLHGHKHTNSIYVDHIYDEGDVDSDAHEVLVISGGAVGGRDACRVLELRNLPYAPICNISSIPLLKAMGKDGALKVKRVTSKRLWKQDMSRCPIVISGKGINEVYERACQLFTDEKKKLDRPVICHIEFEAKSKARSEEKVLPPENYPKDGNEVNHNLEQWFDDTVAWWQLKSSKIEERIPYIHGTRLYRFGGTKNQIARIVALLKEKPDTSKAIAVLLDPIRDFSYPPENNPERFASFCLVHFKIRKGALDCVAYYRAQEFMKWWPVNVAELRKLQLEIAKQLSRVSAGCITTFAADARIEDNVSPTQVAVPLIDQWLDSSPEKIAAIAHAILCPQQIGTTKSDYMDEWKRCFSDILSATTEYSDEGVPVAIEGLGYLQQCLNEFSDKKNQKHGRLVKEIEKLFMVNTQFNNETEKANKAFDTWATQVALHVEDILKLSEELSVQTSTTKARRKNARKL